MTSATFLLLNLALGFYNTGTIWAMEVDIFRSWQFIGRDDFHTVQRVHWLKLPYWIFTPVALALAGAIALVWYHPAAAPMWGIWGAVSSQLASLVLTATTWGRWQARLSRDERGAESPYLQKILATHWVRTALISASALFLLASTITVVGVR
jgi:hypothetical protein